MNLIGACRFIATCAKSRAISLIAAALCACCLLPAEDCGAGLTAQAKLTRFKELDSEAESAMQQRRASDAVRFYENAVCLVPDSARGFYGLGLAEAAAGNFVKARDAFRTSDRLQPGTGMPLVMQVRVNFSLNDIETVKSNLREAAERFPNDAQLHATLARLLAERNLFVLALAEALRSQQNLEDWNSGLQLAILENTVGAYQDGLWNALAVEQNPHSPDQARAAAAGIAGLSYESLHQPEEALRYLKEAIQLDPTRENSYLALADLFEQQQKYGEAVEVLKQGQANVPNSTAIQLPLGADLIRSEHYKEGVEVLRDLLRKAPATAEAYISLADAARKTGDRTQELTALQDLARYKPDYPMIHVLLARAMLNQESPDYTKVLNELARAAKESPSDPDVFFLKGKVYLALNRYQESAVALQQSIALRPTEPSPYYQLARVYQKLGKTELAKEQFRRVKYLEESNQK